MRLADDDDDPADSLHNVFCCLQVQLTLTTCFRSQFSDRQVEVCDAERPRPLMRAENGSLCCLTDSLESGGTLRGFDLWPVSVRWSQRAISLGLTKQSVLTAEDKPLPTTDLFLKLSLVCSSTNQRSIQSCFLFRKH